MYQWGVDMLVGHGDEALFPDVSAFAPLNDRQLLAVRDTKPFHSGSSVLGTVEKSSGVHSPLEVDWSATGRPFDLEAVATNGNQKFLAVEGSRFMGRTPRLMELEVTPDTARSVKTYDLPDLDQEIEGLVASRLDAESQTLILAGRGDGTEPSKLYWGTLDQKGLQFTEAGRTGVEVRGPLVADEQRDITELVADSSGVLWASSTATVGSVGEYRSAVYQVGRLSRGAEQPFQIDPGEAFLVDGPKIEALQVDSDRIFLGSDNESLKGRLDVAMR